MDKKINKFIYWAPRILSILFILFLMMFSLDVFDSASSAQEITIGLFMHNIPALILLVVVIISWKREIVGGIVFILAALAYSVSMLTTRPFDVGILMALLIIGGLALLIGVLFMLNWFKKQ